MVGHGKGRFSITVGNVRKEIIKNMWGNHILHIEMDCSRNLLYKKLIFSNIKGEISDVAIGKVYGHFVLLCCQPPSIVSFLSFLLFSKLRF